MSTLNLDDDDNYSWMTTVCNYCKKRNSIQSTTTTTTTTTTKNKCLKCSQSLGMYVMDVMDVNLRVRFVMITKYIVCIHNTKKKIACGAITS